MAVGDAYVFPGFLTPVLTLLFFQSHRLLFSHASAEVRGENMPERKVASTWDRTHNHQVMSPTRSPLSHPGGCIEGKGENAGFLFSSSGLLKLAFMGYKSLSHNPIFNPFPIEKFLDSSKLKRFGDNNFKFDENGRKFSKRVENTVGKDLYCRHVITRDGLGMG